MKVAYRMSHGRKNSIRAIEKGCWWRSDSDINPFILFRIRNNKINSIIWIPRLILKVKNSGVRKVEPERIFAKSPPLEPVAFLRSVSIRLQTDVELGLIIYRSQNSISLSDVDTYSSTQLALPPKGKQV